MEDADEDALYAHGEYNYEAGARDLYAILRVLYNETADYIRINNLGDVHHNMSMRNARNAIVRWSWCGHDFGKPDPQSTDALSRENAALREALENIAWATPEKTAFAADKLWEIQSATARAALAQADTDGKER